jgi:hypothetical protein
VKFLRGNPTGGPVSHENVTQKAEFAPPKGPMSVTAIYRQLQYTSYGAERSLELLGSSRTEMSTPSHLTAWKSRGRCPFAPAMRRLFGSGGLRVFVLRG